VPYPAPAAPKAPAEVLQRGRELALQGDAERRVPACASCHGATLTGVQPNTPGLLGLSRDYLNSQLGAWRTGQRRALAPDCMAEIARRLSPDDLSAVTAWLASEALPREVRPQAAVVPAAAQPASPRRQGRKAAPVAQAAEPPPMHCGFAQPPVAGTAR
jgi:cytochrome c553